MKIAILGCGAIGGLFLSGLSEKHDVFGVVREYQKEALTREGLLIKQGQTERAVKVNIGLCLKESVDLAVFATKISDLDSILSKNKDYLRQAIAVTTQNGIGAEKVLEDFFPKEKIISSILMSGATFYPPNRVIYNFEGSLIFGNIFQKATPKLSKISEILSHSFRIEAAKDIRGAKYLKLFINLNNCLPAILGLSMQEAFSDLHISKLAVELNKEAYRIVQTAGINLADLPGYPKERIQGLVSKPSDQSAQIFSKVMSGLSKEPLYGSILQSIKRGRPSEIDFINGEIVRLAKAANQDAPLNKKIVELVHRVEKNGFLSKEELIRDTSHLNL